MESSTPTSSLKLRKSDVGEGSAKIAVAVMTFGEKASVQFCWTCEKALLAGLRRGSVVIVESLPVYNEYFVVTIITIPTSQRADALASVKETLAELDLLLVSTIAMDRAGDGWFTVHGLGDGGIKFEAGFLRPEQLDASMAALRKWSNDRTAVLAALVADLERLAAAEGENPKSP